MDEAAGLAATGEVAGEKQLRHLENFSIFVAGRPDELVGLESLRRLGDGARPVASGSLTSTANAGAEPVPVITGPIIDWCLEYGDKTAVWIITKAAWYRLGTPATAYRSVYETVQLRLELAVRCASALGADPTAAAGVVRHRVLMGLVHGSNGIPVHAEQLSEAAEFLAAQMAALHQAGALLRQPIPGASVADVIPFVGWLKQEGAAVAAAPPVKRQRLGDVGQAAVTATTDGVPPQQPLVAVQSPAALHPSAVPASVAASPTPVQAASPSPAGGPPAAEDTPAAAPKPRLKINLPSAGFKPKLKLKGQILPQVQPPPQDMGSQIQGHPPSLSEGQGHRQQQHKPKLKFVMPKGGPKQQEGHQQQQQPQLQHQESWQFSDAQGGWGPPPPYPPSAPHGASQQHRPYDYSHYDYYDDQGYNYQPSQHLTARQQQRAAAAAAKQAAIEARAAAAVARAEEQERRRQQRLLEQEMKRQAEITADIARGAPPPPTRSFRLPANYVADLLMLWELCQAFGGVLSIPPFSLEQLEAALLPGPLTEEQQKQSAAATGAAADAEALKAAQEAAAQLAAHLAQAAAAAERAAAGEQPGTAAVAQSAAVHGGAAADTRVTAPPAAAESQQRAQQSTEQTPAAAAASVQQPAGQANAAGTAAAEVQASAAAVTAVENGPVPGEAPGLPAAEGAPAPAAGAQQQTPASAAAAPPAAQQEAGATLHTASAGAVAAVPSEAAVPAQAAADRSAKLGSAAASAPGQPATAAGAAAADGDTGEPLDTAAPPVDVVAANGPEQADKVSKSPPAAAGDVEPRAAAAEAPRAAEAAAAGTTLAADAVPIPLAASAPAAAADGLAPAAEEVPGETTAAATAATADEGDESQQMQEQQQQPEQAEQQELSNSLRTLEHVQQGEEQQAPPQQEPEQQQPIQEPVQGDTAVVVTQAPGATVVRHAEQVLVQGSQQIPVVQQAAEQQQSTEQLQQSGTQQPVPDGQLQQERPAAAVQDQVKPEPSETHQQHEAVQQSQQLDVQDVTEQRHPEQTAAGASQQPEQQQGPQQPTSGQQQQQQQTAPAVEQSQSKQEQQQQDHKQPEKVSQPHGQPSAQQQQQLKPASQQQTPFAGHMPAPSTTSVGTGQAAASNSVGVTPSPAKQKLKLKVRLSSLAKNSSSQLQQSASGVTGVTATPPAAVDPAAAAAMAVADPAEAAAAAADNWEQQAKSGAAQDATAAAAEDEEQQSQPQVDVGITDRVGLASSLVLRDVHSGLLKLIDGTAPKPGKKPPKQPLIGKLCPGDTNQRHMASLMAQPHWAHRAAYAVSAAAGTLLAGSGFKAQEVSAALLGSDYALLPLDQRLSLLRCLLELALASDTLRAHIDLRIDTYSTPKPLRAEVFRAFNGVLGGAGTGQRGRPKGSGYGGGYGSDLSAGPSDEECHTAAAAAERSIGGRMVDEWMEWISQQEQQSSGFRRPLGVDYRGRQYWVIGGAAGAWRVFVDQQHQQQDLWGFYEGEQLLQLINWLACAAIEAEVPLLHTFCTMPWPYRPSLVLTAVSGAATAAAAAAGAEAPESLGSIAYWANVASGGGSGGYGATGYAFGYCFTPLEAGVEPLGPLVMSVGVRVPDASQLMGVRQMQRLRPDGYRKLSAPLMLGEAGVPGGSVLLTCDQRVQAAMASLVAVLPFWLKQQQQHILQQLGPLMDELLVADSPSEYCQVLLSLESVLADPHVQPPPLRADWASSWREKWRDSLQKTGSESWESLMLHLSMLGRFAVVDEFSLGRNSFMRIVTSSRCPLVFPAVGDLYMFCRTGCVKHLNKYSQLPPSATAPQPPAAEELQATAALVNKLPPVSCYKVVAVAYCSYPMPEALKKQQQQQVAAASAADAAATDADDGVTDVPAASVGGSALGAGAAGTSAAAAAAVSEPGMSDDWPGLATLGDDGAEEIDSLLGYDVAELDIDTLPGQLENKQHQHGHPHAAGQQQQGNGQHQEQQTLHHPANAAPAVGPATAPNHTGEEPKRSSPPVVTDTPGSPEYRPPCMWAIMSPVDLTASKAAASRDPSLQDDLAAASLRDPGRPYLAVPFHVDAYLPDFLVPVSVYETAMERSWLPGDRFSMYFGGNKGQKTGGHYYKGSITSIDEGEDCDPWCSISVLWDNDDDDSQHTATHKVSPWDIETDRDEARKKEEAARKAQQAAAAAEELRRQEEAAAEARARRRASRTIADYTDLIGAVDDDDEYNPLAEGYSSDSDDGRRRRRKGKRGRDDDEDFRETATITGGPTGGKKSKGASKLSSGAPWSLDQIKQQQSTHMAPKQQQMLGAMATGNTLLLARLTTPAPNAPIHEHPFPVPLKPDLLAALPNADSFMALLADYITSSGRAFNPPKWGNRELDYYTLFMVVNVRGGYEAVCRTNRWEDVCRSMGVSVGANSGSDMRSNYEKCLVEFEQYVRCGRFQQDLTAGKPPTAEKSDAEAAFEQVVRAGAAAAAAPPPPPPPPAPVAAAPGLAGLAGLGVRPQLLAGGAGGLVQMPGVGGLQPGATAFVARNAAGQPVIIQATPQQLLALQLAQQQQLLLAKQQGRPGVPAGAPIVLPASGATVASAGSAAAPAGTAAATAAAQQQLLLRQQLLQQAQLQGAAAAAGVKAMPVAGAGVAAAANPHLQALLKQQAAAAGVRPAGAAPVQLAGGLTLQQLQALQAQQLKAAGAAAVSAPGQAAAPASASAPAVAIAPAASLGLPPRPPAAPGAATAAATAAPATSSASAHQALAGTGSMNFSSLLDDLA